MEESLIKQNDKPVWYENDQPIQDYLQSSSKPATLREDQRPEKRSLLKMMIKAGRSD